MLDGDEGIAEDIEELSPHELRIQLELNEMVRQWNGRKPGSSTRGFRQRNSSASDNPEYRYS